MSGQSGPRVYSGDGWEVRTGRWEDSPPTEAAAVIGDPPFDGSTHEGHALDVRDRAAVDFEPIDPALIAPPLLWIAQRWTVLFCSLEALGDYRRAARGTRKRGGQYVRGGVWLKANPAPQMTGDRPGQPGEGLAIMHRAGGKMHWNGGGHAAMWYGPSALPAERLHQTPKPLWLMLDLVRLFSEPGEMVWDPYAGSGTTGVACLRLGRRFLGHEVQPHYAKIAAERLAAEGRNLTLADVRAGQTSIFDQIGAEQ